MIKLYDETKMKLGIPIDKPKPYIHEKDIPYLLIQHMKCGGLFRVTINGKEV